MAHPLWSPHLPAQNIMSLCGFSFRVTVSVIFKDFTYYDFYGPTKTILRGFISFFVGFLNVWSLLWPTTLPYKQCNTIGYRPPLGRERAQTMRGHYMLRNKINSHFIIGKFEEIFLKVHQYNHFLLGKNEYFCYLFLTQYYQ